MIKSPAQWSCTLNRIANTDESVVTLQMTVDRVREIAAMMEILSEVIGTDDLRDMLENYE